MPRVQVREIMRADVQWVDASAAIHDVEDLLETTRCCCVYVVEDALQLIGVISDYTILKHLALLHDDDGSVLEIMSPVSRVLQGDDSVEFALTILKEHLHSQVPVVEHRRLTGAVDRHCVLKFLRSRQTQRTAVQDERLENLGHPEVAAPKYLDVPRHRIPKFT